MGKIFTYVSYIIFVKAKKLGKKENYFLFSLGDSVVFNLSWNDNQIKVVAIKSPATGINSLKGTIISECVLLCQSGRNGIINAPSVAINLSLFSMGWIKRGGSFSNEQASEGCFVKRSSSMRVFSPFQEADGVLCTKSFWPPGNLLVDPESFFTKLRH